KTRNLMLSAMLLFFIGTLIGLVAPSFSILLIGRIFQGIGSGIMIPLMQTILFLLYPREKRGFGMGLASMVISVVPAIGLPFSGVLIKYFEWRSLFYLSLPFSGLIIILMCLYMCNITQQKETAVDFLSILLATIGL